VDVLSHRQADGLIPDAADEPAAAVGELLRLIGLAGDLESRGAEIGSL
jgi:hypothetical protein